MSRSRYRRPTRSLQARFALLALGVGVLLALALARLTSWPWELVWLGAASLTNFLFYGFDKAQARRAGLRVPERVLHGLALAGGALGGGAGMFFWRHKTRAPGFKLILALGLLLQIAAIALLRRLRD